MKNTKGSTLLLFLFLFFGFLKVSGQELRKEKNFSKHQFIPFYNLKKMGNTAIFQGNKKKSNYFEGWYFKMVSKNGKAILSVIPGISLSANGENKHAFIQVINGVTAQTHYFSFPIESFSFSSKEFAIKIEENYFSKDSMTLNLKNEEFSISGKVKHDNLVKYTSNRLINPGIMGWYRFVPFMECYHGVLSLTHSLKGQIVVNNKTHNFSGGKGYLEKDWGSSMPSSWIWMQSNNFKNPNSSFMLSIANIPWLKKSFDGFLGFYYSGNQVYQFATYRSTKLTLDVIDSTALKIRIENRKNTFLLDVKSNTTGLLNAPVKGEMDRRIPESIDASIKLIVLDKKGKVLTTDSTNIAGLELVGDFQKFNGLLK